MRSLFNILAFAALCFLGAGAVAATSRLFLSQDGALNAMRPCSFRDQKDSVLTISGVSANTGPFTPGTVLRLACTTDVHYRTSATASPVAVTGDQFLPKTWVERIFNEGDYVAAIQDSAGGYCTIAVCR